MRRPPPDIGQRADVLTWWNRRTPFAVIGIKVGLSTQQVREVVEEYTANRAATVSFNKTSVSYSGKSPDHHAPKPFYR